MKRLVVNSLLFTFLFLVSCGGGSDPTETPTAPQLLSASIENGAKDIGAGTLEIIFSFSENVTASNDAQSRVAINGAKVDYVLASFKNVSVGLSGLQKGKTYELSIPKGAIIGNSGAEVAAFKWTFSTVAEEQDVPVVATLCTENPMSQTQKVYNYLNEIYGKKILSCAMADVSWNINEANLVNKATGKYPAMNCFDYIHLAYSPANWIDYSNTEVVENWWNAGGLVVACWHWLVQKYDGADINSLTYKPEETTFRPKNIFVEGSWEKRVADADLAEIAEMLLLLQKKGIPVIWRPLHEAAGNIYEPWQGTAWFWWGYDGAEVYKKLWIYMFDYFKSKGINNLIWVWTTQLNDSDFYPGDKYVDIIGRDIYNQKSGDDNAAQYAKIKKTYPNKLIALSECGNVARISDQWSAGGYWSWFMPWYQNNATSLEKHEHADEGWWTNAMNHESVITRDELPSFK